MADSKRIGWPNGDVVMTLLTPSSADGPPEVAPPDSTPKSATPEQELKFRVSDTFALPNLGGGELRHVVGGTRSLDTTYWDTADMRLARRGHTLRYRTSDDGSKSRWTLKLGRRGESSLLQRREVDCDGDADTPPQTLVDALLGLTDGRDLTIAARMRSEQHQASVVDADGRRLLAIEDDRVVVVEQNRVAGSFREVEVELTDATHGKRALRRATRVLRDHGAGEPDPTPKLTRARGPIAQRETTALDSDATVEDLVRFSVRDGLNQLLLHDPGVRLDLGTEDVHQARIATRRLRANLRTLRPLLDRRTVDDLRAEIRWAGQVLGTVRDLDVLRASFARSLECTPASRGVELIAAVETERAAAHDVLLDAMRSPRWQSMLRNLDAAAILPPLTATTAPTDDATDVVAHLLRKSFRRLERRVTDAPAAPAGWHEVRKAAKSTRYAAELLEPLLGGGTHRLARDAERIQTELGRRQDDVVARGWLHDHGHTGALCSTTELLTDSHEGRPGNRPPHWKKLWQRARRSARKVV
ncbi:MAG: CYTH and CHAD domain-containing protein [Acidimicrobiales bacterium]